MYIKKIYDNNVGPIKDALITFPFNSDGTPKPVIIVGENGSGKSTLMKGILGTADLMRAVFNKEHGLRTQHLTTHCMLYEIPALGRMLVLTDGGVISSLRAAAEILPSRAML